MGSSVREASADLTHVEQAVRQTYRGDLTMIDFSDAAEDTNAFTNSIFIVSSIGATPWVR
jgi:hypothetical protein